MKKGPGLSKSELEIARILWEIGPTTVRQIHESISTIREIDFATVQTYLRRLESKGYASSRLEGRTRIYAAKTKQKTVIRETVNDLLNRLFGGNALPLVRHLIEDSAIKPEQIAELRTLIDDLENEHCTKGNSSQGKRS